MLQCVRHQSLQSSNSLAAFEGCEGAVSVEYKELVTEGSTLVHMLINYH